MQYNQQQHIYTHMQIGSDGAISINNGVDLKQTNVFANFDEHWSTFVRVVVKNISAYLPSLKHHRTVLLKQTIHKAYNFYT